MTRKLLLALNDVPMREITLKFFESHGFVCSGINFNEKLLSHVDAFKPHVLICESSLHSRYYSPYDLDSAMALIMATRLRGSAPVIILVGDNGNAALKERMKSVGMQSFFAYPLGLVDMLNFVRTELRRVARLKNPPTNFSAAVHSKRGRPRKYPAFMYRAAAGAAAAVAAPALA